MASDETLEQTPVSKFNTTTYHVHKMQSVDKGTSKREGTRLVFSSKWKKKKIHKFMYGA